MYVYIVWMSLLTHMNKFVSAGGSKGLEYAAVFFSKSWEKWIIKQFPKWKGGQGRIQRGSKGAAAPSRFEGEVTPQNFNRGKEKRGKIKDERKKEKRGEN